MKFQIYKDAKDEHRWRLVANNGEQIAASGEGYKRVKDCQKGIELVRQAAKAPVEFVD